MRRLALFLVLLAFPVRADFSSGGGTSIPDYYVLSANGDDGTGLANDDTEILNALLGQAAISSGKLILPEGIFVLHRSGGDSVRIALDGLTVEGVGKSNRLSGVDSSGVPLHRGTEIWLTANPIDQGKNGMYIGGKPDSSMTRGMTFRDLTIRSSVTNRLGYPVVMANMDDCYFENVDFYTTRVSGANGDGYYAGVLIDYWGFSGNETTNLTFSNCHFWAPGSGGGSGIGHAVLVRASNPGGGVRQLNFINCKFSDAVSPGWSVVLQGACSGCGTGEVAGVNFLNCFFGGHSGVKFCDSHRNSITGGVMDFAADLGDTAIFNQYQSEDNVAWNVRIDGKIVDEAQSPGSRMQIFDPSSEQGPLFRRVALMPATPAQFATPLTAQPLFYPFVEPDSLNHRTLMRWSPSLADTIP